LIKEASVTNKLFAQTIKRLVGTSFQIIKSNMALKFNVKAALPSLKNSNFANHS
jgi:hypothetical protein